MSGARGTDALLQTTVCDGVDVNELLNHAEILFSTSRTNAMMSASNLCPEGSGQVKHGSVADGSEKRCSLVNIEAGSAPHHLSRR